MFVIGKQEGVGKRGLFKGIEASCVTAITYSGMGLALYEPIKLLLTEKAVGADCDSTPIWIKFCSGGLSGVIGAGLSNPSDLVKTRMQAQPHWKPSKAVGWHTYNIWKNQGGISGFYKGVYAAMVRAFIVNATYLGSYDTIKHLIL